MNGTDNEDGENSSVSTPMVVVDEQDAATTTADGDHAEVVSEHQDAKGLPASQTPISGAQRPARASSRGSRSSRGSKGDVSERQASASSRAPVATGTGARKASKASPKRGAASPSKRKRLREVKNPTPSSKLKGALFLAGMRLPPDDPILKAAISSVPSTKPCNCKNSRCLKLYCECFATLSYCSSKCNCVNCHNSEEKETARHNQIAATLDRNARAFRPKFAKPAGEVVPGITRPVHHKGCRCKNSQCMKKYCECFQAGVLCSENCKCTGCKNFFGSPERAQMQKRGVLPVAAFPGTAATSDDASAQGNAGAGTIRRTEVDAAAAAAALLNDNRPRRPSRSPLTGLIDDETIDQLTRDLIRRSREQEEKARQTAALDLLLMASPGRNDSGASHDMIIANGRTPVPLTKSPQESPVGSAGHTPDGSPNQGTPGQSPETRAGALAIASMLSPAPRFPIESSSPAAAGTSGLASPGVNSGEAPADHAIASSALAGAAGVVAGAGAGAGAGASDHHEQTGRQSPTTAALMCTESDAGVKSPPAMVKSQLFKDQERAVLEGMSQFLQRLISRAQRREEYLPKDGYTSTHAMLPSMQHSLQGVPVPANLTAWLEEHGDVVNATPGQQQLLLLQMQQKMVASAVNNAGTLPAAGIFPRAEEADAAEAQAKAAMSLPTTGLAYGAAVASRQPPRKRTEVTATTSAPQSSNVGVPPADEDDEATTSEPNLKRSRPNPLP